MTGLSSEAPFMCSILWYAPDLTHKHYTKLGKPDRDKTLLPTVNIDKLRKKKFSNIVYKGHNLKQYIA